MLRWRETDLRDIGLVENGLDVLGGEVGTSGRKNGGHNEDEQRPPAGPVDHRPMMNGL